MYEFLIGHILFMGCIGVLTVSMMYSSQRSIAICVVCNTTAATQQPQQQQPCFPIGRIGTRNSFKGNSFKGLI